MFRLVGFEIERGALALHYGKTTSEIVATWIAEGWTEVQASNLLRGAEWYLRAT